MGIRLVGQSTLRSSTWQIPQAESSPWLMQMAAADSLVNEMLLSLAKVRASLTSARESSILFIGGSTARNCKPARWSVHWGDLPCKAAQNTLPNKLYTYLHLMLTVYQPFGYFFEMWNWSKASSEFRSKVVCMKTTLDVFNEISDKPLLIPRQKGSSLSGKRPCINLSPKPAW